MYGFKDLWTRAKTSLWRWLDRQPLLTATACLLAGIVCGCRIDAPWVAMAAAALLCVCAAIFMRTPLWRIFVALCILLVGWTLATRDKAGRDDEAHRFRALVTTDFTSAGWGRKVDRQPLRGACGKTPFRAEKLRTEDVLRLPSSAAEVHLVSGGEEGPARRRNRRESGVYAVRGGVRKKRNGLQ